jgi:hypothetical protein
MFRLFEGRRFGNVTLDHRDLATAALEYFQFLGGWMIGFYPNREILDKVSEKESF